MVFLFYFLWYDNNKGSIGGGGGKCHFVLNSTIRSVTNGAWSVVFYEGKKRRQSALIYFQQETEGLARICRVPLSAKRAIAELKRGVVTQDIVLEVLRVLRPSEAYELELLIAPKGPRARIRFIYREAAPS